MWMCDPCPDEHERRGESGDRGSGGKGGFAPFPPAARLSLEGVGTLLSRKQGSHSVAGTGGQPATVGHWSLAHTSAPPTGTRTPAGSSIRPWLRQWCLAAAALRRRS